MFCQRDRYYELFDRGFENCQCAEGLTPQHPARRSVLSSIKWSPAGCLADDWGNDAKFYASGWPAALICLSFTNAYVVSIINFFFSLFHTCPSHFGRSECRERTLHIAHCGHYLIIISGFGSSKQLESTAKNEVRSRPDNFVRRSLGTETSRQPESRDPLRLVFLPIQRSNLAVSRAPTVALHARIYFSSQWDESYSGRATTRDAKRNTFFCFVVIVVLVTRTARPVGTTVKLLY